MKYGYTRQGYNGPSHKEQAFELMAQNCAEIHQETSTVISGQKEALNEIIRKASDGDYILTTSLDRIANSPEQFHKILERLQKKGVSLMILDIGFDSSMKSGKLVFKMLGLFGELKKTIRSERQKEAYNIQIKKGVPHRGRLDSETINQVLADYKSGMHRTEVVEKNGISMGSFYKIINGGYE